MVSGQLHWVVPSRSLDAVAKRKCIPSLPLPRIEPACGLVTILA